MNSVLVFALHFFLKECLVQAKSSNKPHILIQHEFNIESVMSYVSWVNGLTFCTFIVQNKINSPEQELATPKLWVQFQRNTMLNKTCSQNTL